MEHRWTTVDGNEAAALIAYKCNDVIAIYPITPASPMGELSDAWASAGQKNIFDAVPKVIEMQSEGGAAGTAHGSLQAGALTTSFTASQGLLLKIPNMFKIAGELTPTVFHISARTIATHALSIFGDHSDVMAARSTGWAMLSSGSVQEVHDMALISQMATLKSRVPFLHFFDGFRTSHEVNKIAEISAEDVKALIDHKLVADHRDRALNPDRPVLRGTAQNPDVFFQAREACNPYYAAVPSITQQAMNDFAQRTGRQYHLFDYHGAPDAEHVVVLMASGIGAATEAVDDLVARGEKVGLLNVRLYRPFDSAAFVETLPKTTKKISVLDRTKEPGATGEPLYQEVLTALVEEWPERRASSSVPKIVGGRYGLSSKEFTPAMVVGVFDDLKKDKPKNHFTVGIIDDVTHTNLAWDSDLHTEKDDTVRALFYGLGSDGTVGATKNTVKIVGESTPLYAQGYFVYDSRKAGSVTVSHLRIGPRPINSTYLISKASFVGCHQSNFLERMDMLSMAETGATFMLNSPYGPDEVWQHVPLETQQQIIDKQLKFYVVDAAKVARDAQLGNRINTVMQTCFFKLAGALPEEEAIAKIKEYIQKTYGKRGETIVNRNYAAVDGAIAAIHAVKVPQSADNTLKRISVVPEKASDFVQRVTSMIVAGQGDLLPVSALPVDGTFPTDTARWEKRSIALEIPIWDEKICTECGLCALACPHAAIRTKAFDTSALTGAPSQFVSKESRGKDADGRRYVVQVAPDDCTGCAVCVDVCPARSKEEVKHKAINMMPKEERHQAERDNFDFFLNIPELDRASVDIGSVKGSQQLQPLFEFSGACSGCGETPYVKLMSQLFGDRMLVANATGCSSIYGGNLPTTPWSVNRQGQGPAWSNSLFEDNAEFGLGMRLAINQQRNTAQVMLKKLSAEVGNDLADALLKMTEAANTPQELELRIRKQREQVAALKQKLAGSSNPLAADLAATADCLIDRSVWILGGDGWAYDIGFGGVDHVLASGENVNLMVLDTEVYSNTGGQASKATPRAAVAKFATGGKQIGKKDLGMIAAAYGNVYVAQIAMGANPKQTVRALIEAEAYPGPSLIIAYSTCIAHGIDMTKSQSHMKDAVNSGYWPLYRYIPNTTEGSQPFKLDSRKPRTSFKDFAQQEARFAMLMRSKPEEAARLGHLAQQDIDERWRYYEQLAGVARSVPFDEEV